jgi:ArsR family transcriptional regulator
MIGDLNPEALELVAERFRILAEPIRLRILNLLLEDDLTVSELTVKVGSSQPNVSKHLKLLLGGGIIGRRQQGNNVYYSIIDKTIFDLCETVCGSLEKGYKAKAEVFRVK